MIKDEVLNTSFASVFSRKASCLLGTQPSELEGRNGEQNEASIIQEDVFSNLLCTTLKHTSLCNWMAYKKGGKEDLG